MMVCKSGMGIAAFQGAVGLSVLHNNSHYWFVIWVSVLISPR